jgi:hypothetical protein
MGWSIRSGVAVIPRFAAVPFVQFSCPNRLRAKACRKAATQESSECRFKTWASIRGC